MADIQYYGTGRRKTSTARVYLRPGTGEFKVNKKTFEQYFPNQALRMIIRQPLTLTDTASKFDIVVNVAGGGPAGRTEKGVQRGPAQRRTARRVAPARCATASRAP